MQIVSAISHRLSLELESMRELLLERRSGSGAIDTIGAEMSSQLTTIGGLLSDGQILPQCNLRLFQGELYSPLRDRPLRIGFFPITANPIHWVHLLGGLKAMALHRLDKVIYLIAGTDPRKPDLLRADIRHLMGQNVLRLFVPLFAYSPIALGSVRDGETNMFRILQQNPGQRVDAFYIAGTDHYNRHSPATGMPDTIQKLERGVAGRIHGYDDRLNSISVIFLGRDGGARRSVDTFLNVESVPRMPLQTSSTSLRKTLAGDGALENLAALPYSAYRQIRRHGLYSSSRLASH